MSNFKEKDVVYKINVPKGSYCRYKDEKTGELIFCPYINFIEDSLYIDNIWSYGHYCSVFGFCLNKNNKKGNVKIIKHTDCLNDNFIDWR